jgi:hypothetical protein
MVIVYREYGDSLVVLGKTLALVDRPCLSAPVVVSLLYGSNDA